MEAVADEGLPETVAVLRGTEGAVFFLLHKGMEVEAHEGLVEVVAVLKAMEWQSFFFHTKGN